MQVKEAMIFVKFNSCDCRSHEDAGKKFDEMTLTLADFGIIDMMIPDSMAYTVIIPLTTENLKRVKIVCKKSAYYEFRVGA